MTLDNEEAELSVGQEVPFITGSFTGAADNATNPFQTIEREEVGVLLQVTPQINDGDAVRLEIVQESSSIAGSATALGTADTVTNKSTISTNVMVGDGELLILGGLIDNQITDSTSKIPVLGDIPILGNLFRSRSESDDGRVLMVFIRPTILRSIEQSSEVTRNKFDYLEAYELRSGQSLEEIENSILHDFDPEIENP